MPGHLGHLVRVGALGNVGNFRVHDGLRYARHARVVCRTVRGLEIGEVLTPWENPDREIDGTLLRGMTIQDELLWSRIEKHKARAFDACSCLLQQRGLETVLVDVELLFDGQSIFFYFLGDPPDEVDSLTAELAETYEAKVRFRRFAETVTNGCGPGCGTESGGGCGDSCTSCAVAGACATATQRP